MGEDAAGVGGGGGAWEGRGGGLVTGGGLKATDVTNSTNYPLLSGLPQFRPPSGHFPASHKTLSVQPLSPSLR